MCFYSFFGLPSQVLKQYAAGSVSTDSHFLSLFFSEINQRQRAILEEFAEEEIKNGIDNSNEGSWSVAESFHILLLPHPSLLPAVKLDLLSILYFW